MHQKQFTADLQIKSLDEGGYFEGYASVFGVQDSDGDVIVKGAFQDSIKRYEESNRMPKMLWQHDHKDMIGKWLEMREDENGLYVKGSLIMETQRGAEAYALLKAGVLDAMSVGFNIDEAGAMEDMSKIRGRVIEKADLWEISMVTWGANPKALVTNVKSIKDFEKLLRDAGFSRKQATAIASNGYKAALNQSDSETEDNRETIEAIQSLKATIEELSHG